MPSAATIKFNRHTGRDAGIQAKDGNLTVVQVLHLGNVARQSLPSLDAGFRHPCRNDRLPAFGYNAERWIMGTIAILLSLLCFIQPALAQTPVSGAITSNTHWTVADGPYLLGGDVTIQNGAALTIDAGATVYMGAKASLTVQAGSIQALGTVANPIQVLSDKTRQGQTAAPGDWKQWGFGPGTANTRLDYVEFAHGSGLAVQGSAPVFNYLNIHDQLGAAITIDLAASPSGVGNKATGNTLNGISVPAGDITGSVTWGLRGIPYLVASGKVGVGSAPRIDRLSPNTLQQGTSDTFSVYGSRLAGLDETAFDLTGLSGQVLPGGSDSAQTVRISAAADTPTGSARFSAMADAGSAALADALTVIPRLPKLTGLNPVAVTVGQGPALVEILGERLISQSTAILAGNPIATTFNDAGKITATVPNQTNAGSLSVRVRTPDPRNVGNYLLSNDLLLSVAAQALALSPQTLNITRGTGQTLSVQLAYPAPAGGTTINLASSAPAIASVPSAVTIPAGTSNQVFTVTGAGNGTASITASQTGYIPATATANVIAPPGLGTSPAFLAIPPDNLPHAFSVTLDRADTVDYVISVSSNNAAVAVASPASATLAAGQRKLTFQITGKALGQASLKVSAPGLIDYSTPVYVSTDYQGINTAYSSVVGVQFGDTPITPSVPISGFSPGTVVGVTQGMAWLNTSPRVLGQGTSGILTLTGRELPANLGLTLNPSTGIGLGAVVVAGDGSSASLAYTVAADAPATVRRIAASSGTKTLLPAEPTADRVSVVPPPPEVYSISPIAGVPGGLIANFAIAGRNLGGSSVLFVGGGVTAGPPVISADGSSMTFDVQVDANATLGTRTVVVHTAAGDSSSAASSANTFYIVNPTQIGTTYTPILSALVGVSITSPSPPPPDPVTYGLQSPVAGVVYGSAVVSRTPATGATGDTVNLNLTGQGLQSVTAISFNPPEGLTLGAVSATGQAVSVPVTLAADAPLSLRRITVKAGATVIPFADATSAQFLVTPPTPVLDAASPIVLPLGSTATALNLYGRNFQNASQVRMYPPEGVTLNLASVSADGTSATATVTVAANAAVGPRVVSLVTPAGETGPAAGPNNTLTLSASAGIPYTGLASSLVGVQYGSSTPPPNPPYAALTVSSPVGVDLATNTVPPSSTYGLFSPHVGVYYGATALSVNPAVLRLGETASLTVSAANLPATATLALNPATGLTLQGSPVVGADKATLTQSVAVADNAPTGPRQVAVMNGTVRIPFADPSKNAVQVVTANLPSIDSISPILAHQGDTLSLTVRGANFGNVVAVAAEPSSGILFSSPTANVDGSQVTVAVQVTADAPTGPRAIRVYTLSGGSPATASPANTFTLYVP
jgi:hypothetical protein